MVDFIIKHTDPTIVVSIVVGGLILALIFFVLIVVWGVIVSENRI